MNDNPFQMKQEASALRKQKRYQEALDLYKVLWTDHRAICDHWDGWGYAQSLRKAGRSEEALVVCEEVHTLKPDFDYNNNLYAWCLYDQAIAGTTDEQIESDETAFFDAADRIMALVEPGKYSPYGRALFRVIDYLKSRASYPTERVLEWTGKVTPDQLSTEVGHGTGDHGKPMEYASEREKWYAERCRALFEAGDFQACITLADEALGAFTQFHYDNDVWFRWRRARAEAALGDTQTAIQDLQSLLTRKKDWFVYHRIAQYQYEQGQLKDAWGNAINAALGPGDLEYKWELFLLMGMILRDQGELGEARRHILLAARIRQEHDWKIPQELASAIGELDVDMAATVTAVDLQRALKKMWLAAKQADLPRGTGEVIKFVSDGRAGFIAGDDGKHYYFKVAWYIGPREWLSEGLLVEFLIEKNQNPDQRDNAIFVTPLKN